MPQLGLRLRRPQRCVGNQHSGGVDDPRRSGQHWPSTLPQPAGSAAADSCVTVELTGGIRQELRDASPCAVGDASQWRHGPASTITLAAEPTLCLTLGDAPPPSPGVCPDGTDCTGAGGTCCKLKEPFGYGCALGGGSVCCDDKVHYCPGYVLHLQ